MKTEYKLRCMGSNALIEDDCTVLESGLSPRPAFLRTEYERTHLSLGPAEDGLYRFADWLPVHHTLDGSSAPVTYKSTGLGSALGLSNLFITFNGYWPDRGVVMTTGTFKECEAFSVCARLPEEFDRVLVVASAGNTARAFINVCSKNHIPLIVVVPEANLPSIWADHDVNPCVRLIAAGGDSDYSDAIALAKTISSMDGFVSEGGAKNVGRRDGMGATFLSAVTTIGAIPRYYFQAVGSGTGAIAAWEANLRLIADGRYGTHKARLMVSQNAPFLILHDSWKRGVREQVQVDADAARRMVEASYAKVLSNRKPPYGVIGGLYDALTDTRGDVLPVDNAAAERAGKLFEQVEGIDIAPAAAVAVASLVRETRAGRVDRDAEIMLNVTGGGYARMRAEKSPVQVRPSAVLSSEEMDPESVFRIVTSVMTHGRTVSAGTA